jgi:hypothetical protein
VTWEGKMWRVGTVVREERGVWRVKEEKVVRDSAE